LILALTLEQLITSIVPIIAAGITALIGVFGAKRVVNIWQTRKDISEVRKGVLHNYTISFKNHVNLMDDFVAELIMSYGEFGNAHTTNGHKLSGLLPWGYTYRDLKHYSTTIDFYGLKNWKDEKITKEEIRQQFEMLKEYTECYIDFQEAPLKKFGLQYSECKTNRVGLQKLWVCKTNFIKVDQQLWSSDLLLINIIETPKSF
jgi:hypothetical protein